MRKLLLTLVILFTNIALHSQNENPFKEFGYDVLVATSSKGEFQEFHDQTDIVEIGSVLFNRQTKEIVKILDKDETTIDISSATAAMSIDPHCEKYYWISPYAYVMNNPLKFVDPNGLDVYIMNSEGKMILALKTENDYDRLYAFDSDQVLTVRDQSILPNFGGGDFSSATTSNIDDAFNVFKFAADNSKVEWRLSGAKDGNFVLGTSYNTRSVKAEYGDYKESDLSFDIHSHPNTTEKGASGYEYELKTKTYNYNTSEYNGGQDGMNVGSRYTRSVQNKTSFPNHYVYTPDNKALYHYTPATPANKTFHFNFPSSLKNIVHGKNYNGAYTKKK